MCIRDRAVDYIKKSPLQNITVTDVADYLHISRNHLYGLFKKHLGTTPQAFLTSAKIINARELLTITDIPVSSLSLIHILTAESQNVQPRRV